MYAECGGSAYARDLVWRVRKLRWIFALKNIYYFAFCLAIAICYRGTC